MTRPLQYRKRFFLSLAFMVLFVVLIPIILLYSIGYRFDKEFSLRPTGGMYVFYSESGAEVYLDGELSTQTSLFERGIFIDKLSPDIYELEVRKEGYVPWKKIVEVPERKVSEAYPFLIPEVIATSSIPSFLTLNSGVTVTNLLYNDVRDLFATSTATMTPALIDRMAGTSTSIIASSTNMIVRKNIEISIERQQVVATWRGSSDSTPFYFCDPPRLFCEKTYVVVEGDITHVDFYPGRNDVVIYSTKNGIFVTELDKRPPQNTHKLLSGKLDFKEDDDRVFVKESNNYYEILFTASTTLINPISI